MSKRIFLLRHAKYDGGGSDPSLGRSGIHQARNLGRVIRGYLHEREDERPVVMWSSTANRASETAREIAAILGLKDVSYREELWSDDSHAFNFDWLKDQLDVFQGGVLIIISHLEYVRYFPRHLGFEGNRAEYAKGVLIEGYSCRLFPG